MAIGTREIPIYIIITTVRIANRLDYYTPYAIINAKCNVEV